MTGEETISEDSSFYGGEDSERTFERKETQSDPDAYWLTHHLQPAVIATRAKESTSKSSNGKSNNYYEGNPSGRQLAETVEQFLARLPPLQSRVSDVGPWIFIADPSYKFNITGEDIRGFKIEGQKLLASHLEHKTELEGSAGSKLVGQKLTRATRQLETDIYTLSRAKGILSGKWMFFPSSADVNRLWSAIAHATAAGELGHAAKVATDDGSGQNQARLICVYTQDFGDTQDVKRVLQALSRMGLVTAAKPIYYKADALTHLDVNSKNEWGLKPSLYASKDVLKENWSIKSKWTTQSK